MIEKPDPSYIKDLINGWLQEYRSSLPLSGKVVQVVDNRVIIDIPASSVDGYEQDFLIVRPTSLKYEEIKGEKKISWKKKVIAKGVIDSHNENHSVGKVWEFVDKNSIIQEGDWIVINQVKVDKDTVVFKKHNIKSRRKAGNIKFIAEIVKISEENGRGESLFNAGVGVDLYLPKGYLILGEAARNFSSSDGSISNNNFSIAGGYSFTPRLLNYFSLIDAYIGYRIVNYNLEELRIVGIKSLGFKGPFIGSRVEVPIYNKISLIGGLNLFPFDSVKNDEPQKLFGEADSSRAFELNLIAKYRLTKTSQLFVDYKKVFFKSTFENPSEEINVNIDSDLIRAGFSLDF